MNKDIIYIDTEDDITAIIGKIKASKEKIIALVPPKRTGVLQSAVNIRLLARIAKNSNKRLVIITNNKALIALSSSARIPVAKDLQSKPEIAEIAALEIDDGEDIIEGAQLPVGEFVKIKDYNVDDNSVDSAISTINIDDDELQSVKINASKSTVSADRKKPVKSGIKVPDFSSFRKKLFLGILAGILLVIFFVWAIWFAPAARIIITTKPEIAPVSMTLKLGGVEPTNIEKGIVQTITKQIKKDISVEFTATGKKDFGKKATGTITVENCDYSNPIYIAANTVFTSSSSKKFINPKQASVPAFSGSSSECRNSGDGAGTIDIPVVAEQSGPGYNIESMEYSINGVYGDIYAQGTKMSGGTSRLAAVVTAEDVQKAGQSLVDLPNNDVKQQLIKQFTNGEKVIEDSFNTNRADAISLPEIGSETPDGKAKLTSSSTFTMDAIAKSEMQSYLKNSINKQLSDDNSQRIYDDGIEDVVLSGYSTTDEGATVNITANGKIGPNIKQEMIKEQIKGKHFGDVQSLVEGIKGVDEVDIKFSYFWIRTVPSDVNKIDVEFILKND